MHEGSSDPDGLKRAAARSALDAVRDGMLLGLGTGSTVAHFLDLLGEALRLGRLKDVSGIPTSEETAAAARRLHIPLAALEDGTRPDLAVDGADEVDPSLDLVKGMGGALLREKMVAQAASRFLVIVDEGKIVSQLGTRSPVPVEVVPFGWATHLGFLRELGAEAVPRAAADGSLYRTDNGNHLLHCRFTDGVPDAWAVEDALRGRAGVVETGFFLGLAHEVLVAGPGGVRSLPRERSP